MKLRALLFGTLSFCLLWFIGWEAWAVFDARAKTEEVFAPYADAEALALTWTDLTPRQQEMLLRVEDPRFWHHRGIDIRTPGAGKTTITQALAKRLYFERFTPGFAKIEQTLIAFLVIDPLVAKDVQMNAFLTLAYFGTIEGDALTGFDQASRHFFRTPVPELNDLRFARLVGMLIAPNDLVPGSEANHSRTARIIRLMADECAPLSNADVYYDDCG